MSNMLEIGTRIKDEREKRNLTQEELASQAKIESYQTLGKIERGERKDLKTTELQKIAEALGVSIGYLLGEFTRPLKSLIFWRKEPTSTQKTALENRLHSFIEDYSFLEEVLNQNKKIRQALPVFSLHPSTTSYEDAHEVAEFIRKTLDLGGQPSSSLRSCLEENFDVKVLYEDLGDCSAACTRDQSSVAVMINKKESLWRQNYNLAHELYHLITWNPEILKKIKADPSLDKRNEELAENFAAGLLIPAEDLKDDFRRVNEEGKISPTDVMVLSSKYKVSTEATIYRLLNLGCILKGDATKLLSEVHRESLSKENSIKFSEKLVRLAFLAYQKEKISKARLAQIVGVSLIDLPNLLAAYDLNEPIQA
jgi:XRE family transcriptional regulator, fatty acid utilization regulator